VHVLILPSWYPRFDGDAEGSFFRDQAIGLAKSGLKVGIVFPDLRGPGRYFKAKRRTGVSVRRDGAITEVRSHGFNWFPRSVQSFGWLWRRHADKAFKIYLEQFGKPDIVHVHSMEPAATAAARLQAEHGIPFVITEHATYHLQDLGSCRQKKEYSRLAALSSRNIAVSQAFADKLNALYGGSWMYLPNIVSPRFLEEPLIRPSNGEFRLVSVALLARRKRMDLVIETVAELRNRGRNVVLTIIGDGEDRPRLRQLVAELGLAEHVHFAGQVAVADMPKSMAKGHLLVSASEFETFGVTLVEGMALGMPLVATRSGGPESIVTPDVGKLVGQWHASEMADAVEDIMNDLDRFRPADIRKSCASRFSTPVISEALKTIYSNALSNAP
jgi:L-malate glycosyltransferase